jgi:peptidyl-prolyl cis-trans isomerase A (cyclophilin A)
VWGKVRTVGSQTKFEGPASLKEGETYVTLDNYLDQFDFKWRLRLLDGDVEVAAVDLLPESLFGSAAASRTVGAKILSGRVRLTPPLKGRLLSGELEITDSGGRVRIQRIESPRFLEARKNPKVRFETDRFEFVVELDPTLSPAAVDAFLDHVRKGDYEGTVFHDLRRNQFVKAGVYDDSFTPKAGATAPIPESWTKPKPTTSKGTLALTGQSEFLIHVHDNPNLDVMTNMVEIGKVVRNQEALEALALERVTPRGDVRNAPEKPLRIKKVTLED